MLSASSWISAVFAGFRPDFVGISSLFHPDFVRIWSGFRPAPPGSALDFVWFGVRRSPKKRSCFAPALGFRRPWPDSAQISSGFRPDFVRITTRFRSDLVWISPGAPWFRPKFRVVRRSAVA